MRKLELIKELKSILEKEYEEAHKLLGMFEKKPNGIYIYKDEEEKKALKKASDRTMRAFGRIRNLNAIMTNEELKQIKEIK